MHESLLLFFSSMIPNNVFQIRRTCVCTFFSTETDSQQKNVQIKIEIMIANTKGAEKKGEANGLYDEENRSRQKI